MKTNETFILIDPPSGWKYGFPKAVTPEQYKEITSLKQWCINNGYPKKEADSYGDYFYVQINGDLSFMNKETSTRELASKWWNNLPYGKKNALSLKILRFKAGSTATDEMIEKIWRKETQWEKESHHNDEDLTDSQIESLIKPNQKQFKEFNETLFKAYIDKFSSEDKLKILNTLVCSISTTDIKFNSLLNQISNYK